MKHRTALFAFLLLVFLWPTVAASDSGFTSRKGLVTVTPNGDGTHKIEYLENNIYQKFAFDVIYHDPESGIFFRYRYVEVHYEPDHPLGPGIRNSSALFCTFPRIVYSTPTTFDGEVSNIEIREGPKGFLIEILSAIQLPDADDQSKITDL